MISYDRSSGSKGVWLVLAAAAVGIAAATWWWTQSEKGEPPVPAAPTVSEARPAAGPVVNLAQPPQEMPDGRPADFTASEWSALKEAVGTNPNGAKELKRITAFLRYQRGFEQWQSLLESGDASERHALANQLLDQLPQRLVNMEMTMGESLMLCAALLNDLEPDENQRQQKLEGCKSRLEAAAPKIDSEQALRDADCRTEFLRRQAALVAEYQALPASQKDHAKFERDVEAARRAVYDSPTCGR